MRVGEKETSEQAAIIRRYADLFTEGQLDALREDEEAATGDDRERLYRLRKTCEARPDRLGDRRARGRAREPLAGRAGVVQGRGVSAALRPGEAGAAAVVRRPRRARRDPGRRERARSTPTGSSCCAGRRSSRRGIPASPTRSSGTRRRRASRCASSRAPLNAAAVETEDAYARACATSGSSGCSAPTARRDPDELAHGLHAPALAARGDVHQGSRDAGLPRHAARDRLRPVAAAEHQARPRRPAAEVAARLRDRERSAVRRAPDHARAGRHPRLPGVPARGRSRAALRRLRPVAAVHLPPHLARPCADRDLLVHRRGDLHRARLAPAVLRADRGGGARERRGDAVHRDAALPPLRGEAPVRARLLVALPATTAARPTATRTR